MRTLITGGAGFIGSHLCDFLLGKGFEIVCVDNLITGDKKNIKRLKENKKFEFVKHDVSLPLKIKGGFGYVMHLASPASPVDYIKYPIETLKANSLGTLNTLEFALKKKAKYFLASTSEVYGDPLVSPQNESYFGNVNPVGPRSVYDEGKRFGEALTTAFHKKFNLEVRIARFFNTYGPRMRINDGRVVPNFIFQAKNGDPLTVYGDGVQTRSFCYISDLIEGIYLFMRSNINEPVNLGNPVEFKILDFAKLINKMFKRDENNIIYKTLPQDDPKQRRPDITKAASLLDWKPTIALDEGIAKTIKWFGGDKR